VTGFIDTNVLIYCFQPQDPRSMRARALLDGTNHIGVQSLNEFTAAALRRLSFNWAEINRALASIRALTRAPIPLTLAVHETAVALAERHRLQWYDALLLAAALSADCTTFWSEDLHAGLVIDSRLTIRNPFA
jgi:predicted nucleic acid-binding protein